MQCFLHSKSSILKCTDTAVIFTANHHCCTHSEITKVPNDTLGSIFVLSRIFDTKVTIEILMWTPQRFWTCTNIHCKHIQHVQTGKLKLQWYFAWCFFVAVYSYAQIWISCHVTFPEAFIIGAAGIWPDWQNLEEERNNIWSNDIANSNVMVPEPLPLTPHIPQRNQYRCFNQFYKPIYDVVFYFVPVFLLEHVEQEENCSIQYHQEYLQNLSSSLLFSLEPTIQKYNPNNDDLNLQAQWTSSNGTQQTETGPGCGSWWSGCSTGMWGPHGTSVDHPLTVKRMLFRKLVLRR